MQFNNPDILFLLWAVIPLAGILIYAMSKRNKILYAFAGKSILESLAPGRSKFREWLKLVLVIMAFIFAILALADPRLGFHWEKTTQRGVDIMIALDCSRSMLAEDIVPNRLERAKREILDLISLMKSDRAGLVAFAGIGFLQCPLTLDYKGFDVFLRVLSPEYLPLGGTSIKAAIDACYSGFDLEADTDKAIILITDGEDTSEELGSITKKMAEKGIRIFAVGVGDIHGAPVPDPSGGFVKDSNGSIVMSRVNEQSLKQICSLTNGHYVRSVAGDMDLEEIYTKRICNDMNKKEFQQGRKKIGTPRFQWFLFLSVFLLLLNWWLPRVKYEKKQLIIKNILLITLFSFYISPAPALAENFVAKGIKAFEKNNFEEARKYFIQAQLKKPEDFRLYFNIGTAAYKNREYDLALDNFTKAGQTSDPQLRNNAFYNMGNTMIQKGELKKAKEVFEHLLESFPNDTQARENLEWVKKKLEEAKKEKEQKRKNKEQDQEQKKEDSSDSSTSKNNPEKDEDQRDKDSENPSKEKDNTGKDQGNKEQNNSKDNPKNHDDQENKSSREEDQKTEEVFPGSAKKDNSALNKGNESSSDSRLNRLEDKPGAALIPRIRGHKVKKDW